MLEVVVASALTLLMITILYLMLTPSMQRWFVANRRSALQQHGLVATYRIVHDIELTCIQSVWCDDPQKDYTDPATGHVYQRFAFLTPLDVQDQIQTSDDGEVLWQGYRVFYLDKTARELFVGVRPLQYEALNDTVVKVQLQGYKPRGGNDRILARNVDQIQVEMAADAMDKEAMANPVKIRLHLKDENQEQNFVTSVSAMLAFN